MPTGIPKSGKRKSSPRSQRIAIACEVCGKVREYLPSEVRRRGMIRFCGRTCMGVANRKDGTFVVVTCAQCGVEFNKRHDHLKERNFCSADCRVASRRQPNAKWRNLAYIKAYMAEYCQKHKDEHRVQKYQWAARNQSKRCAICAKYRVTHKDFISALARARRAKAQVGDFTAEEWEAIKRQYNYRCLCCGRQEPDIALHADHIVPLALGGPHTASNIQPLCRSCNSRKGKTVADYRPNKRGQPITSITSIE